jgi:hypothetical protein
MKAAGMAVSMAALLYCFFRWYRSSQATPS